MESIFRFKDPSMKSFDLKTYSLGENISRIKTQIDFQVSTTEVDIQEENYKAVNVSLKIRINDGLEVSSEENNIPFKLGMEIYSTFSWPKEEVSEKMEEDFLKQNAPALLLSYARPIIYQNTGATEYPGFHLPFINFVQD